MSARISRNLLVCAVLTLGITVWLSRTTTAQTPIVLTVGSVIPSDSPIVESPDSISGLIPTRWDSYSQLIPTEINSRTELLQGTTQTGVAKFSQSPNLSQPYQLMPSPFKNGIANPFGPSQYVLLGSAIPSAAPARVTKRLEAAKVPQSTNRRRHEVKPRPAVGTLQQK